VQDAYETITDFVHQHIDKEWAGPLLNIGGNKITVQGASGSVLNPDGARWWDGEGGNGGKTKPKFFSAHDLTDSTITNLNIKNTPVQAVSIAGCDGLTITGMTIDDSAGDSDSLGHNTDGFDIGTSNNVVIDGAKVYNQDDCVAVNSGTVRRNPSVGVIIANNMSRASLSKTGCAPADTVFPLARLVGDLITQSIL
jgi:polygalacturonase